MADEAPTPENPGAGGKMVSTAPSTAGTGDTIIQIATVTQEIAGLAMHAIIPPPAATTPVSKPAPNSPVAKPATTAALARIDDKGRRREQHVAAKHAKHKAAAENAIAEKTAAHKAAALRCVGRAETGTAAWYGGRYVGRRTTSGERLDNIHATAAHRTLPLNSLARVTNLRNGRSVVVRVTDRGPIANDLLIDMSPRAAAELQMKEAGVVPVKVEQVVEVPDDLK